MMCSNCCRPGHNRLHCPTPQVTDAVVAEGISRLSWGEARPSIPVSVPMMEDHVEAIRIRLALLKGEDLLRVRRMVEEALGGSVAE